MSELSRETRELLDRGRQGSPLSPGRRERLRSAVLARAAVASVATATSAAAWTTAAAKIGAVLTVLAVAGAGLVASRSEPAAPRAVAPASPASASRPSSRAERPAAPPAASAPDSAAADPEASPLPAVSEPRAAPPPGRGERAAPAPALPGAEPARVLAAAPEGAAASGAPAPAPSAPSPPPPPPGATAAAGPPGATAAAGPPGAASAPAPAPPSTIEQETRLLRDADRALRGGDAAGALRLLDEHGARFPRSALEPERSAERIFALCRAGRVGEARAAAGRFLEAAGPLAARVRASCGGAR